MARLTRQTSGGRFIPEIDGLRFICIALVVVFHLNKHLIEAGGGATGAAGDWFAPVASHWHYGVELFFIISGFVLALPFACHYINGAPAVGLKTYLVRRLTRIEPPYLVTMTVLFALMTVFGQSTVAGLLPHYTAGAFYVHNIAYGTANIINLVAWSLEVEIQFYLVMPVLGMVFAVSNRWRRRALMAGIAAAAITWQAGFASAFDEKHLPFLLVERIQFFLAGLLLADIYVADWKQMPRRDFRWDAVALLGWPALFALWGFPRMNHFVFPFAAMLLFAGAFRGRMTGAALRNAWITTVGGMCYTIYLLHYPLLRAVGSITAGLYSTGHFWADLLVQAAIFVPILLAVSTVFFVMIERPCMEKHWPQRARAFIREALVTPRRALAGLS